MKYFIAVIILSFGLIGCSGEKLSDAYGNFEADEVIVGSEGQGKILSFNVKEGEQIPAGTIVGYIDTMQLSLKKQQLIASINAVSAQTLDVQSQLNIYREQKKNILREQRRVEHMLKDEAATQKELDNINGNIEVVDREIEAARKKLETNNRGILSQIEPIERQIDQINDQINKSLIMNPISGTVLTKYSEEMELAGYGTPLYKIAGLDEITLKVYVSGDQLSHIKIGQEVEVLIDDTKKENRALKGTIKWIASEAEFTPKIVQTKDERVDMVYAVKILVQNDGYLKIGMPGEINFTSYTSVEEK
ncbi:MAG: HlyD family efflux transporter periplasmic adaptor subunit [Maribacter sp.]